MGVIGFCWGGRQSFRYATDNPGLDAVVVCYGRAPPAAALPRIQAPVLGVYGANDARVNADLPDVERAMAAAGKAFRYTVYPDAGHAFLRREEPAAQVERAWEDIFAFLAETLGR